MTVKEVMAIIRKHPDAICFLQTTIGSCWPVLNVKVVHHDNGSVAILIGGDDAPGRQDMEKDE